MLIILVKELGEIATYLLIIWGILQCKFNKKIWVYTILSIVLLFVVYIVVKFGLEDDFLYFATIFEIISIIVIFEEKLSRKIVFYIATYINAATLYMLILSILYLFPGIDNIWLIEDKKGNIIVSAFSNLLLLLVIFLIRNQRKKIEEWIKTVPLFYFILMSVPIVFCNFLMLYLQNKEYFIKTRANVMVSFSIIFLAFFLICWSIVFITINASKKHHKLENSLKTKYLEVQKDNYEKIIEKDIELKKFRHDIKAHMACMQMYLEENKIDELQEYIYDVKGELSRINKMKLKSGNEVVDAILNHLELEAKKENINIIIDGSLPINMKIGKFDLCTIIYNTIQNSIEACKDLNHSIPKNIKVDFKLHKEILYIDILNPINKSTNNKKEFGKTTKRDKINHGFGIGNIKNAVEKYNGDIKFSIENDIFKVNILLYDIV